METVTADNSSETERLLQSVADGDQESWGTLLTRHEERLRRMVAFRMDQRLQGRIDPLDVIQEAYLEASEHRAEYLRQPASAVLPLAARHRRQQAARAAPPSPRHADAGCGP